MCNSVVLPHPVGPMIPKNSRSRTSRLHPTERAHAALAGRELLGYTANDNFHVKDLGDLTAKLVLSPSEFILSAESKGSG